jgi:MFS family permease
MQNKSRIYHVGTLTYTPRQLGILFFWLLWGDFCFVLMETVIPSIIPVKFGQLGASNTTLGIVLTTIPMALHALLAPIISFRSDRYRSRWGRRIPFILVTLPFLAITLIGVGYGEKIGLYLYPWLQRFIDSLTPNQAAIVVISIMMTIFSFFNVFVNSVFWYLFNDVVPEHLLARFMSWFRIVSTISSSVYAFFLYKHGAEYAAEICLGAALLYIVGFGLMCLNIKEGEYPLPPKYLKDETGPWAAVKTFGKECHSLPHYWYIFLISICMAGMSAVGPFSLYYLQTIGLDLEMIGQLSGVSRIAMAVAILISGVLADRYHPIRIVLWGIILSFCITIPLQSLWYFWMPSPKIVFYVLIVQTIILGAPIGALLGMMDPPMFMRLFPRDRYGQFCSANALWRSLSSIISGGLVGVYLDLIIRYFGKNTAYCLMYPVWQFVFMGLTLYFMMKLYRSWKQYGGDENYVAPMIAAEPATGKLQLPPAS